MTMNPQEALRLTKLSFPETTKAVTKVNVKQVCRLWAGMGHVYELSFRERKNNNTRFIVKCVDPDPSQVDSIGGRRKANSYQVEANFYERYAEDLIDDHDLPLPRPLYVERNGNQTILCMTKLESSSNISNNIEKEVMKWLAKLHASTWKSDAQGLHPIGSYWYLDTRPDEHADMPRKGWQGRLKRAARAIDSRLQRDDMQCIIHGDAKDANILFTENGEVAMCDFQYCGKGPPTRDLAYFLCSSTYPANEEELLQVYYNELIALLPSDVTKPTMDQLKESLEIAFADYCRFMAGWGFWGNDLSRRVTALLDRLDGGKDLGSEEAYDKAMRREFG